MVMRRPAPFVADEGWNRVGAPQVPPGDGDMPDDDIITLLRQQKILLEGILRELQERVQDGLVTYIANSVASTAVQEVPFGPPLFAITIVNDGPAAFEYRIPNRGSAAWVQINVGEAHPYAFTKGKIDNMAARTLPAGVASNYRLIGIF